MKLFKKILLLALVALLSFVVYMVISFPPIMAGMAAKTMCSCKYIMHRTPQSVRDEELSVFPGLSKANVDFNEKDSSVTASVLGRSKTAIYRNGLGCTLLAQRSEAEVRAQPIAVAKPVMINQDTIDWPAGDRLPATIPERVNQSLVNQFIDSAFIDLNPGSPVNTHGVVVVYDGRIIGEKYAPGYDKHSQMMGWSMGKSITNALTGILVGQGKLKTESPAPITEWAGDERKSITLNNLLQASSGLAWSESYLFPGDFHNMFIHSDDKGEYALQKERAYPPNTHFQYSSGTTNILSKIIRQTVGDSLYYRFPYEFFFNKIGMYHTTLEPDAAGTFVGSSYAFASARDWARFGLLYLNDGVWNGNRILPEGWITYTTTPAPASKRREYGAQWWLNAGDPNNASDCKFPGLPSEAIIADGFENQFVVIVPSKKIVVVRLGVTHHGNANIARLVNGVIKALPQ